MSNNTAIVIVERKAHSKTFEVGDGVTRIRQPDSRDDWQSSQPQPSLIDAMHELNNSIVDFSVAVSKMIEGVLKAVVSDDAFQHAIHEAQRIIIEIEAEKAQKHAIRRVSQRPFDPRLKRKKGKTSWRLS